MEATLQALRDILIGAIPTFVLVIFLHFYLKAIFFRPLERVLAERRRATEGARSEAAASLQRAEQRALEYEESLRAARNEIYREHEEQRRIWREEQSARIAETRRRADEMVKQAREQLAREADEARRSLEAQSVGLADEITRTVLEGVAR